MSSFLGVVIGVDIGGSHVSVCAVRHEDGFVLRETEAPVVHRELDAVMELVFSLIDSLMQSQPAGTRIICIGVGSPGQPKDGEVVGAANFPTWKNAPLVRILKGKYGVPAYLFKDSDAAFAAEIWTDLSPHKDARNAVMISEYISKFCHK